MYAVREILSSGAEVRQIQLTYRLDSPAEEESSASRTHDAT